MADAPVPGTGGDAVREVRAYDKALVYRAAAVAALAGLLNGFDTGIINGALPFLGPEFSLTPGQKGLVTSFVLFGAILGAIASGAVISALGRRLAMAVSAVIFGAATLVVSTAVSVGALYLGRGLLGVAIGISAVAAPLYIAEVSPANKRGLLVTTYQLMITIGILASFLIGLVFTDTENWRAMFLCGLLPAALLLLGMVSLPESPRWLMARGREDDASAILQRIYAGDPEEARHEVEDIRRTMHEERGSRYRDLIGPTLAPIMLVVIGIFVFQQLSGINSVIYYSSEEIFPAAFGEGKESVVAWATLSVGVVNVLFTLVAMRTLDRFGRKPVLYAGFVGMAVCLAGIGLSLFWGWAIWTVAFTLLFVACFASSLGPVPFLLLSELFPNRVRAKAASIASLGNWVTNWLVTTSFPVVFATIGQTTTYLIFAACCVAGFFFARRFVPETKGKTLEQIEEELAARRRP